MRVTRSKGADMHTSQDRGQGHRLGRRRSLWPAMRKVGGVRCIEGLKKLRKNKASYVWRNVERGGVCQREIRWMLNVLFEREI